MLGGGVSNRCKVPDIANALFVSLLLYRLFVSICFHSDRDAQRSLLFLFVTAEAKDEVEFECKATNVEESQDEPEPEENEEEEEGIIEEEEGTEEEEEEGTEEEKKEQGRRRTVEEVEDVEDEEEEEEDEEQLSPEARGIVIQPTIEIKDKIKYKISAGKKGVEVKVTYKQEFEETGDVAPGAEEVEGETKTKFEIVFDRIIEYAKGEESLIDASSTALEHAYDWDLDEEIQSFPLDSWADFTAVTTDDGIVSRFSATSEDGIVAFNFSISRADQDEHLTVNSMKIDLHIIDFPWNRSDTYLALISTVTSELEVDMKYDDEATALMDVEPIHQHVMATEDVQIPFISALNESMGFISYGEYKWERLAEVVIDTDLPNNSVGNDGASSMAVGRMADGDESLNVTDTAEEVETPMGQPIEVVATSPVQMGNETFQTIAYSFVGFAAHNASHIYWDPSAGIGYGDDSEEGASESNGTMNDESAAVSAGFVSSVVGLLSMISLLFAF
jgi:hypothetical protein